MYVRVRKPVRGAHALKTFRFITRPTSADGDWVVGGRQSSGDYQGRGWDNSAPLPQIPGVPYLLLLLLLAIHKSTRVQIVRVESTRSVCVCVWGGGGTVNSIHNVFLTLEQ